MQESDIVVIGASTAGLFTSYLLARQGMHVRLFDQTEMLGPPARTLIVTSKLSDTLGFVPSEAIVNRTPYIQLLSRSQSTTMSFREPDLILEREKLVQLLVRKAQDAGVEINLRQRFSSMEPDGDGLVVNILQPDTLQVQHFKTRVLIGADGAFSQVAQAIGKDHHQQLGIWQAKVRLPAYARADTTQIWFDRRCTPFFYWLIPESKESGALGVAAENSAKAKEALGVFASEGTYEVLEFQEAEVPAYSYFPQPEQRIGGSRILLVGDAARHVKVTTVGGVVSGLRGARAAARAIVHRTSYTWELRALRLELGVQWLMRVILNKFSEADYDHLLIWLGQATKGVLATYTRDEAAKALPYLILAQPKHLWLAARVLLKLNLLRQQERDTVWPVRGFVDDRI